MAGKGHNSGEAYRVAADELRSFVERIEKLNDEKSLVAEGIAEGIKEVKAEAKARGDSSKTIDQIVKLRARDRDAIAEERALLEMYLEAMGMGDIFG